METALKLATIVNAAGTLIVAFLVYRLTVTQFRSNTQFQRTQNNFVRQNIRIALLERRAAIVKEMRPIWGEFLRDAKLSDGSLNQLIQIFQQAQLVFEEPLISKIDNVVKGFDRPYIHVQATLEVLRGRR